MYLPKISVIVPTYNSETYLDECLNSLINQTYKNIEIIVIDNASTDKTKEIIASFSNNHANVKFLLKKRNSGYGNSINLGISLSSGEYIGIVESDDFCKKEMYQILVNKSSKGKAQIVKCNFFEYKKVGNNIYKTVINKERNGAKLHVTGGISNNIKLLYGHPSIWSAIYKKSFLLENNIKFDEITKKGWEDNPFFLETFLKAKQIKWVNKPLYFYRKNHQGCSSEIGKVSSSTIFHRSSNLLQIIASVTDLNIIKAVYFRCYIYSLHSFYACKDPVEYLSYKIGELMSKINFDLFKTFFSEFENNFYIKYYLFFVFCKLENNSSKQKKFLATEDALFKVDYCNIIKNLNSGMTNKTKINKFFNYFFCIIKRVKRFIYEKK